jgi:pyrroloquinoline quinone biosynthesis protein B
MKIRVLGAAAGGGFPQWNCNCRNCAGVRAGTVRARPRTQSSIAVRGNDVTRGSSATQQIDDDAPQVGGPVVGRDGRSGWALVNVSPDITAQMQANPAFQPGRALRDCAITGIVLVDGQVDHTTGLYMLRESTRPWPIWCTDSTYADLTRGNPILNVLGHFCGVSWRRIDLEGQVFEVDGVNDVQWRAIPVLGKPAPYSPNRESPVPGDNLALVITNKASGRSVVYAPGLGEMDDRVWRYMEAASCVMVDGTFWTDDEMIRLGASKKHAREIGHLPQSGAGGMLEWLDKLPASKRKVLIHINNTNPILDQDSEQAAACARRGIEVAWDGMEIEL